MQRENKHRYVKVRVGHVQTMAAILVLGHVVGFRAYFIANSLHDLHVKARHLDELSEECVNASRYHNYISGVNIEISPEHSESQRSDEHLVAHLRDLENAYQKTVHEIKKLRERPLSRILRLWGNAPAPAMIPASMTHKLFDRD